LRLVIAACDPRTVIAVDLPCGKNRPYSSRGGDSEIDGNEGGAGLLICGSLK